VEAGNVEDRASRRARTALARRVRHVQVFQLDGVETPILEDLDPHPAIATP
jgi:hypothetical protein